MEQFSLKDLRPAQHNAHSNLDLRVTERARSFCCSRFASSTKHGELRLVALWNVRHLMVTCAPVSGSLVGAQPISRAGKPKSGSEAVASALSGAPATSSAFTAADGMLCLAASESADGPAGCHC